MTATFKKINKSLLLDQNEKRDAIIEPHHQDAVAAQYLSQPPRPLPPPPPHRHITYLSSFL